MRMLLERWTPEASWINLWAAHFHHVALLSHMLNVQQLHFAWFVKLIPFREHKGRTNNSNDTSADLVPSENTQRAILHSIYYASLSPRCSFSVGAYTLAFSTLSQPRQLFNYDPGMAKHSGFCSYLIYHCTHLIWCPRSKPVPNLERTMKGGGGNALKLALKSRVEFEGCVMV